MRIVEESFIEELIAHHLGDLDPTKSYGFSFSHRNNEVCISEHQYSLYPTPSLVCVKEQIALDCLLAYPHLLDRSKSSSGFLLWYDEQVNEQVQ